MDVKSPKTFEEQAELLQQKGFLIDDKSECIAFLHKANYYRLSAYLLPFARPDGSYFPDIPFSRIQKTYQFNSEIRRLLFGIIEEIEFYLRTQFAYYHAHKYGALGYLEESNFSSKHKHSEFPKKVEQCIKENRLSLVVLHHQNKYDGLFPLWVIIEFFSMGTLSRFYSDMITFDKKELAQSLYKTSPKLLASWLHCLTNLRNRCAHYSRLYFWSFSAIPRLPKNSNYPTTQRLFSQILMLKFLYPNKQEWNEKIVPQFSRLIHEFLPHISLKHLDFPDNWEDLLLHSTEELA